MSDDAPITLKEKVRALPDRPGVYLMKDRLGTILYVGKAKSLKKRVSSYFQRGRARMIEQPKIRSLIPLIHDVETIEVRSEPEALLLEGRLIKQWKPRYNTDFTDDKRFLLVRVDLSQPLPRFVLTRLRKDKHSRYFGPFAQSGPLRTTLAQMRRQFGILLADASPARLPDGRWRLYDDVRQEIYGHENILTAKDYRTRVEAACEFLEGKSREWLARLRSDMQAAAAALDFEKAARLRDLITALAATLEPSRRFERTTHSRLLPTSDTSSAEALRALQAALALPTPPEHMECFDISHISGTLVVASMVHFSHGRPDTDRYRRYRIKSFIGNDDFRAMHEVVARRYHRLASEGRPLPDLVVIDGGRGQIGAALKAFAAIDLTPPPLIGLAKKHETILFADERPPLNLSLNDPALNLLQRLRDEAHRFANTYNADLRSRKIRESALDDISGLGPKRKAALLAHFGSIDRLRAAPLAALAAAPGIGPSFAQKIHYTLNPGRETQPADGSDNNTAAPNKRGRARKPPARAAHFVALSAALQ
ncbi:excinuclease ABC subunit UvrC [Cephaloticoccus primus]|uniref:excinuclease ABC subunit UvrC n=1 Tax=Cephaloticoccus primus TaxID=1548207 RepID=UPI0009EE478A|nr:excinuclease ABC subunit UvrC [Cephaloticoccus primus]